MPNNFPPVRRLFTAFWLLAMLGLAFSAGAYDVDSYDDANQFNKNYESKVWHERSISLPEYPDENDFSELPEQLVTAALTILVDVDSVEAGEDGVVRYVMALRSPTGAQNIFYDGVRCSTREWKTYAYGSAQRKWRKSETDWRPLERMGAGAYRYALYNQYLCERSDRHLKTNEIQQRLRYGRKTYDDN